MPMSSQTPTAFEQQMLEYINRARLDPSGEFDALIADAASGTAVQANITSALRYFGVDLALFREQLAAHDPVAPLAWNGALAGAAEAHSQVMIDTQTQGHQIGGEPVLRDRVVAAGYEGWSRLRENVFAYTDDPLHGHAAFYIDWGAGPGGMQDPAGHRLSILSATVTEVGIGVLESSGGSVGPYVVTQDFGNRRDYAAQLVGVVIDDADGDAAYDIGEGLGGITVTATGAAGSYVTTSWAAGGYQMALPEGVYEVSFAGAGIAGSLSYSVTMGAQNLKLDAIAIAGEATVERVLRGTAAAELLAGTEGLDQVLIGNGGADRLVGAGGDDLLFGDTIDPRFAEAEALSVYRLYQATLGRAPDPTGFDGWTERLVTGERSLLSASEGFVASREFQASYGALDDAAFVELLYRNVLGRGADATGLAGWTARLEDGMSRAEVVAGFSQSAEFVRTTSAAAHAFLDAASQAGWSDDVYRLYQATLGRAPDAAGFEGWTERLSEGRSLLSASEGFVASREFQASYGALDDAAFVELLYRNVLGRGADATGLAGWTARLEDGMSRAQVVAGFSQSAEFVRATAAGLESWMRAQGPDDRLDGGAGENLLVGGLHADVFVFSGGTTTVADFEPWDSLRLEGFGFADPAAARAAFVQEGADLVFGSGGDRLTLLNVDLEQLTGARLEIA